MTETLQNPPALLPARKRSCWKKKIICLLIFIALIIAGAVALTYCPLFIAMRSDANTQTQQRIVELENRVQALNARINEMEARSATAVAPTDNQAVPVGDVSHLQNDVAALTTTMTALQTEVKQSGANAQTTQASLATAIAYIQLRQAALSGQTFAPELTIMRDTTKSDTDFQQQLSKLDSLAAQGAPTSTALYNELLNLESGAAHAVEKSLAQSWWERILVEMKGLISIRRQHGGLTDAFPLIEASLAKGDVKAALDAEATLPPEAQQTLTAWRSEAEARLTIDNAMHDLGTHFTSLTNTQAQP